MNDVQDEQDEKIVLHDQVIKVLETIEQSMYSQARTLSPRSLWKKTQARGTRLVYCVNG
jgi:hypothetical protein